LQTHTDTGTRLIRIDPDPGGRHRVERVDTRKLTPELLARIGQQPAATDGPSPAVVSRPVPVIAGLPVPPMVRAAQRQRKLAKLWGNLRRGRWSW
jgi:hypothetical protein